jgi:hypothetical protein
LLALALAVVAMLLFQIQFGRNFLAADSTLWFLGNLEKTLPTASFWDHLPLLDQQYDELVYGYPLFFHAWGKEAYLFPFWVLDSVGKAATLLLLFALVRVRIPGRACPWLAALGTA